MTMENDPMEDAEIGETRTVEHETEWSFWDGNDADPYIGFDRDHEDLTVESAEIVGDHGSERVRIEYSAEVTKQPEAYPDTNSQDIEIERPSIWWYFKTPAVATALILSGGVIFGASLFELLPLWLVFMIVWMAWSIISGIYPWSMRMMGGFR